MHGATRIGNPLAHLFEQEEATGVRFFDRRSPLSDVCVREDAHMASTERADLRGKILEGRYRIGACIGVGGTGVVFEAERISDGVSVVIKTMRPVFAHNTDLVRRLRREAEVARRVNHPGIVRVLDEGLLQDGSPFIVMERIRAESLSRFLLRNGQLQSEEAVVVALRVAAILHAVHRHGYVHRDIKPEHVMLDRTADGDLVVSLLDFGVCASDTAPTDERERERGRVFGTPTYVSPEQAMGNPDVDARADVYGLGLLMYESLTGRVPFTAPNVAALLRRIIREDATPVATLEPSVPRALEDVVTRAVARNPEHRFASARALARALVHLVENHRGVERTLASRLQVATEVAEGAQTVQNAPAAA